MSIELKERVQEQAGITGRQSASYEAYRDQILIARDRVNVVVGDLARSGRSRHLSEREIESAAGALLQNELENYLRPEFSGGVDAVAADNCPLADTLANLVKSVRVIRTTNDGIDPPTRFVEIDQHTLAVDVTAIEAEFGPIGQPEKWGTTAVHYLNGKIRGAVDVFLEAAIVNRQVVAGRAIVTFQVQEVSSHA